MSDNKYSKIESDADELKDLNEMFSNVEGGKKSHSQIERENKLSKIVQFQHNIMSSTIKRINEKSFIEFHVNYSDNIRVIS
jgi:hypothetical protein